MNVPRCLIAEDEPLLALGVQADLARLWPGLEIVAMVGDGASAVAQALALQPQVCFLDIRMPGPSGLDAAQTLAEDWPDGVPFPLLVFVTAYDQCALQAFEAQAVDYLVKPVEPGRLAACVSRLQARLAERAGSADVLQQTLGQLRALLGTRVGRDDDGEPLSVIQAQIGNLVHMVPVEDVIYFEAADKYVRVVTAEREHLIRLSLKELLPRLDAQAFWQVHRGAVVQARCIVSARRDDSGKVQLTLRGRLETVSVSRLYAHRFRGL
ncbi:MAG: DNA-binding response regulator [Rubrivivax sp. SCN 70-15]|nr:MAG: DNA-binding response regulator [Rubrivivax sp. SCN 70-15]